MNPSIFFSTINSWDDFKLGVSSMNNKEKGDLFELLVKLYFKLSPKFSFYDEVWLLTEVPTKVLELLEIPSHDLGIDLVAKVGNEYHPIQCKFHSDTDQSVTFKEVSTFISMLASNDKFAQGYICSTADLTSRNYNKLKTKPINLLLSDTWQELGREFFDNVRNHFAKKKIHLEPFQPREHQKKALADARNYFVKQGNSRGKLIFPCGAGKSLTGFWMMKELKAKSTLIAVPSLSLVKQTLDVYLREIVAHKQHVKWLCICSDEGIGTGDDVVFYTENLGVPCQTDPTYIENWMREHKDSELIVFTTYQSGRIIGEVSKKLNFSFDLGIFDEAHKTVGSDKKLFSHLLFDENISVGKRIFMTATERFYRGSKDDIISMDDYDIYGDTFTQMSFKEAIDLGLLTDYKVITIEVKKSEIADFIRQNSSVQLNDTWKKESEARSLASMLALRKAMKLFPIKNAVSFHSSIEKATRNKELQQYITDTYHYDPIDTFTVSGKLPTTKRNVIVQEFAKSPKSLITNARCLTEGVDVPNIDCIVFSDPRKSKVDIVQALGRALRRKEGKDWGYVILPVIYDAETHEIDNENFQEILSIVRGLASNDERIVEYFKEKSEQGKSQPKREKQFQLEVFSEFMDESELSSHLEIRLWEKLSRLKWMTYDEAHSFVIESGINSVSKFREIAHSKKRPFNLPTTPDLVYKFDGWSGWGAFFGTFRVANQSRLYITYAEARAIVESNDIRNHKGFRQFLKSKNRPLNFPGNPKKIYASSGWLSWEHFFGIEEKPKYLSFEQAREIVHTLNLRNQEDWRNYSKSPNRIKSIPNSPWLTYKGKGWINLGDWLGTGNLSNRDKRYRSFEEARKFVHSLKLKSVEDWISYANSPDKPNDIPSYPSKPYKNSGWVNWADWLGKESFQGNARKMTFEDARKWARGLGLNSMKEWEEYCRSGEKPTQIPNRPSAVYKNSGWNGWGDWLGTGTVAHFNKEYMPFHELKQLVKANKITTQLQYREFYNSLDQKDKIPSNPHRTYKDMGWVNWADFLGKDDKE